MEPNVVSLETAKKLQVAGFPQDTAVEWLERPRNNPEYRWELAMPWQGKFITGGYAAPTAQEIADHMPKSRPKQWSGRMVMNHPLTVTWNLQNWHAHYGYASETDTLFPITAVGESLAEALAALWLKLRENATIQT